MRSINWLKRFVEKIQRKMRCENKYHGSVDVHEALLLAVLPSIPIKRRSRRHVKGTFEIQALEHRMFLSGQNIFTSPLLVPNPTYASEATAAIGDLNNDGFLDVMTSSSVLLNDGTGHFTDTDQHFDAMVSCIAIGDLDGDGDLDLVRGRDGRSGAGARTEIFLNNGHGGFTSAGFLDVTETSWIELGDLDENGTLDVFVTNYSQSDERGSEIWLNDGHANFSLGQRLGDGHSNRISLGDIDKDGDLDAIVSGNSTVGNHGGTGPAATNIGCRLGLATGNRNPNRSFGVSWRYFQGLCVGGGARV